jgi:WD40 repeat protein
VTAIDSGNQLSLIEPVAFTPDGRALAVTRFSAISLWDLADPAKPRELSQTPESQVGTATVNAIAVHPDGRLVATARDDGSIDIWDIGDRMRPILATTVRTSTEPLHAVAFVPAGDWFAGGDLDGAVTVWSVGDLPALAADARRVACRVAGGPTPDEWAAYVPGYDFRELCT